MNNTGRSKLSVLVQAMVFAVFFAASWAGLAQEGGELSADTAAIETEQVNINHADAETIARVLVGIGMSRAEAIVSYREEFGEFTSLDDLRMVRGVGQVTLENNASRIRFE